MVPQNRIWGICDIKEIIFEESKQENFTHTHTKCLIWGPVDNSEFAKRIKYGKLIWEKSDEKHRIMKNDLKFKKLILVLYACNKMFEAEHNKQ